MCAHNTVWQCTTPLRGRAVSLGNDGERCKASKRGQIELATSSPALMWTSVGHVSVASVSTIPSVGRRALFAIPVLNLRCGISTIAVPVVSEPVPAVVGT